MCCYFFLCWFNQQFSFSCRHSVTICVVVLFFVWSFFLFCLVFSCVCFYFIFVSSSFFVSVYYSNSDTIVTIMKMDGSFCCFGFYLLYSKVLQNLCYVLVCLFYMCVFVVSSCLVLACFSLYTVVTIVKLMLLSR